MQIISKYILVRNNISNIFFNKTQFLFILNIVYIDFKMYTFIMQKINRI